MYPQRYVLETLRQLGCSQSSFSGIVGVNAGDLSRFLRGAPNLSYTRMEQIRKGIADLVELAQKSSVPIDWKRMAEVRAAIAEMRGRDVQPQPEKSPANAVTAVAILTR